MRDRKCFFQLDGDWNCLIERNLPMRIKCILIRFLLKYREYLSFNINGISGIDVLFEPLMTLLVLFMLKCK